MDAFLSYPREELDFAQTLVAELTKRGKEIWVDMEGIAPSTEWLEKILLEIARADSFVFILTPNSVKSRFCLIELARAQELGKKVIPIMVKNLANAINPTAELHWIDATNTGAVRNAADQVVRAMELDHEFTELHTRFLRRAMQWSENRRSSAYLARGKELDDALSWLQESAPPYLVVTDLQQQFISASASAQKKKQRIAWLSVATLVGAAFVGVPFAVNTWKEATLVRLGGRTESYNGGLKVVFEDGASDLEPALNHLVNQEVLELNLAATAVTDADLAIVARYESLTRLNLSNTSISANGLEYLRSLDMLQRLEVDNLQIDDEIIRAISELPSLETLSFWGSHIDGALRGLASLKSLDTLDFTGSNFESSVLDGIDALTQINRLIFDRSSIEDEHLEKLADLYNLEELHLDETSIDGSGIRYLSNVGIRVLSMRDTDISEMGLGNIPELPKLERLDLTYATIEDQAFEGLIGSQLKALHVQDTNLGDEALRFIGQIESLEELGLKNNRVSNAGLVHLRGLKNLRSLALVVPFITDHGVAHLEPLTNLEKLFLGTTRISDAGFSIVQKLPRLRVVYAPGTNVTNAGLVHLMDLDHLENVNFDITAVSEAGLQQLREQFPNISTNFGDYEN